MLVTVVVIVVLAEASGASHQQVGIELAGPQVNHDVLSGRKRGRVGIHVFPAAERLVALLQPALLDPVPPGTVSAEQPS